MDEVKEGSPEPERPPTKKGKTGSIKSANGSISLGANPQTGQFSRPMTFPFVLLSKLDDYNE